MTKRGRRVAYRPVPLAQTRHRDAFVREQLAAARAPQPLPRLAEDAEGDEGDARLPRDELRLEVPRGQQAVAAAHLIRVGVGLGLGLVPRRQKAVAAAHRREGLVALLGRRPQRRRAEVGRLRRPRGWRGGGMSTHRVGKKHPKGAGEAPKGRGRSAPKGRRRRTCRPSSPWTSTPAKPCGCVHVSS